MRLPHMTLYTQSLCQTCEFVKRELVKRGLTLAFPLPDVLILNIDRTLDRVSAMLHNISTVPTLVVDRSEEEKEDLVLKEWVEISEFLDTLLGKIKE